MTKHNVFKRTLAGILAVLTVAVYMPANVGTGGLSGSTAITASAAEIIDSGTKGSLSWTLDDEGTLFISGSGEVPNTAFWNATWGNATRVKKIVTDESSAISKFNEMSYACYSSNTPLSEVEINTTVPLTLAKNAFFYESNNAVNYTINAPEITEIAREVIYDYNHNAVNMVLNVEKPIKFYKNTFTRLSGSSTFKIPAGSVIDIPAGYVFTNSRYQKYYDEYVEMGMESDFWEEHSNLTEGVDYTYNEEAQEILLTAENTNQVFGNATVTFYTIYTKVEAKAPTTTETGNTEYYEGSDGKYYVKNGDEYTEIEKDSWIIPIPTTNLKLSNLGDAVVTDSSNTEITDTSALTGGTYYIYTNKSIADSDVTEALSMGYKKNQTYNGTKYQYRYEIEVPEVPEDGYVLSHTNNWVGKVETSNTSVLLIGEDGVFGSIGAELKGEGTYYYGDQPSADSVQITDGFESVVSVGEVYFAQANGTKVETPEIGKSYYLTAEVFVDKSAEIEDPNEDTSVFYLKQKVNYVKRPLEKCEVYLKNGETETKLTVKNGAVTIPANTFTYNGTAQKPEIVIKNNVLGTETTLTSSDYTDTLEEKTDAGNYSATFTATDDASYTGSLTVNWSIAKATATVTAEPVENIIYDGAPLDKTDFTFTDENNVLNSADAVLTIEGNNGGDITNAGERTAKFTITSRNYNNIVFTVDADIQKRNVKVIPADGQSIIYGTEEAPVISITTEKAVDADDNGEWDTKTGVIPADVETVDFVPTITIKDFDYTYFRNNANTYKYEVSDHVLDNYIAILDGTAIFTVEPKELTEEMFDIWEVDYTFDGTKKLAPKFEFSDGYFKDRYKTNKLTANDFTVGGTDHAVLPGTYTLEFSGQNNYTGLVSFDWEIKPIREYSIYASVESKTYDGKTVIPTSYLYETADADKTPVTTIKGVKTTCTYYEYDGTSSITEEYVSGLTALNGAPKDAGTYLLKVSKTAKGYAFEDYYTTFTISQKEIAVTPNATGKIFGEFDPDFTDFSYDESAVIEGETPKITGAYALDEYEGNVGTYSYNIGTIEIDDNNYYLTISGNYVVKPQELTDKNLIIFKECTVGDDGWSYPGDCIKVTGIVNGEEIELIRPVYDENTGEYINTDFEFVSATKTKKTGEFSVQIQGVNNYTGFAEAVIEVNQGKHQVTVKNGADLAEAIMNVQQGKHQVTVKNGAFANGETSAYFADGAIAVATADNPADGYKFGYWKKNGSTISYNPTYTFFVTSDNIELEAVYVEDTDDIERYGNAVIESVTPDKENKKIQFVSLLNVPEGCKILKAGIVATSDETKSANLTDENADFVRYGENLTVRNYKYTWTKNNVNETWYVKGYLVYEDANGETKTVYSDLAKATLDSYETIEEEKILGTAVMESVTPIAEEKKIQFVAMLNVPADCTINKAGIVATSDAAKAENLTAENADYVRTGTTTKHGYRYTWTKSNVNETWYVRPYLVYTSANGKEYTVYGDLATGTLN